MPEVLEDRLSRFMSTDVHLRRGTGNGGNGTIDCCVVQAADWLTGGKGASDAPDCVDIVIRNFAIRLNDAPRFADFRDELKPYAARIANTNQGEELTWKRIFMCADWTLRELSPMAMDALAEISPKHAERYKDWAARYRAIEPIVDRVTARAGYEVARELASAAYAADAADAADAASAAYAAYAADAASAAYAADARVKAHAFTRLLWDESLKFLDRLILITGESAISGS